MKGVQSLWTQTPRFDGCRDAMMLHTLTLCYMRRHFDHVELVTDSPGLIIADRLRWEYDSFTLHLNEIPREISHIWATGKLYAQLAQNAPYYHVDNDFLLFDSPGADMRRARVGCQGKDEIGYYMLHPQALEMCRLGKIDYNACPYNTGIVGGNDVGLLHRYCIRSIETMKGLESIEEGSGASIFGEQLVFGQVCREEGVRPLEMIPMPISAKPHDMEGREFVHLFSWTKKDPRHILSCEARLKREFPEVYRVFNANFPWVIDELSHPRRRKYAGSGY